MTKAWMMRLAGVLLIIFGLGFGLADFADAQTTRSGATSQTLSATDVQRIMEQLSPEQRQVLQQLPAGQRRALLEQYQRQFARTDAGAAIGFTEEPPDAVPDRDEESELERELRRERIMPGDTLVLRLFTNQAAFQQLPLPMQERSIEIRTQIERSNPFPVGPLGRIELPSIGAVAVAGLKEDQAVVRLQAIEHLRGYFVTVTRLPLLPVGTDALEPFGYRLFQRTPDQPAPSFETPVPADYVLGPGDVIRVQLFGNRNADYELTVGRDGRISFPELGPIGVAAMSFADVRTEIGRQVQEQFIGTRVSVTIGELRSIRVFLAGDVTQPGAYTISSLSTITHALMVGGGVDERGSLRAIELKREGRTVATLDLYRLLLQGDSSADLRVQQGDVVFVPPAGPRVTVVGEVRRPAIYELRGETRTSEVIALAGGFLSGADPAAAVIQRMEPEAGLRALKIDLGATSGRATLVQDGDILDVPRGRDSLMGAIELSGHVRNPGIRQWREGLRLSEVLPSGADLRDGADTRYVLVRREPQLNAGVTVFSVDLYRAWREPGGSADSLLMPRDRVMVFNRSEGRRHVVEPLLDELRLQRTPANPLAVVRIGGRVKAPGEYPLEPGMRVSDLLRAGGGMDDAAFVTEAELTRYVVVGDQYRDIQLEIVNLPEALLGLQGADLELGPYDFLNVKEIPRWREQETVEILGEVSFPGMYPISQGETLASVIQRAGGLTELAFPAGAIFTRESLKEREREQLDTLAKRLESDLTALAMSESDNLEALSVGRSLLQQLRTSQPTGRLVISGKQMAAGAGREVLLRDGDRLMIPQESQEITVLGEVQYSTSHLYAPGLSRGDYIARSGGLTAKADRKRIYVVRANGEVLSADRSRWFASGSDSAIAPGDTIVVPIETDRIRPLLLWSSVTSIIYNLAIAAAAVNSF
jgi:polysaccharide biosynthesis/export protein